MNKVTRIAGAIIILLIAFYIGYAAGNITSQEDITSSTDDNEVAHIVIDYGNGEIEALPSVAITESKSVFDTLHEAIEGNVEYKDYGGEMGVFIESIKGKRGINNAWWQFWVNGRYSNAGASNTYLEAGDTVVFVLTSDNPEE